MTALKRVNDNLPPVWHTKDGTPVLIRDMSDRHLLNTLNMIVRKNGRRIAENGWSWAGRALAYAGSAPDSAAMEAERCSDHYTTPLGMLELWEKEDPTFQALMQELRRRRRYVREFYRGWGVQYND